MAAEQADFSVLDITLRRMDLHGLRSCGDAESRPGILEMICNCLVLLPHWLQVDQQDRLTVFRLADVLYLSWTGSWETLPSSGEDKTKRRHVVCFVPQRDTSHWERAIQKWEQTAAQMDEAAAHLTAFFGCLPRTYDGTQAPVSSIGLSVLLPCSPWGHGSCATQASAELDESFTKNAYSTPRVQVDRKKGLAAKKIRWAQQYVSA